MAYTELLFRMFVQFGTAHQHAADVRAHLHVIFPERLAMQHRVIPDHFIHLQRRHAAPLCNLFDEFCRDRANLVLRVDQHRDHGRTGLSFGILLKQLCETLFERGRKCHRSVSPRTKSMEPSAAIESAISVSFSRTGSACRFPKLGVRIWTRYGFEVPSLTM